MNEIDLSARLKQLEAEVDNEIQIQNDTRQKIWEEMTGHKAVTSVTDTFSVKLTDNPLSERNNPDNSKPSHSSTDNNRITLEDINAPVITNDDFSGEKWALTLAGGGAKGAYQLGVWEALRKIKLEKNLIAVSGSSVGALNAALISLNDFDTAKTIWTSIMPKQFLDINLDTIIGPLDTLVKRTLTNGLCSRDGLIGIIDQYLKLDELASSHIPAYVCVSKYNSDCIECLNDKLQAEYISLSEVTPDDAEKVPARIISNAIYLPTGNYPWKCVP